MIEPVHGDPATDLVGTALSAVFAPRPAPAPLLDAALAAVFEPAPASTAPGAPRTPAPLPHLQALDGLRGVAIALVVLFHFGFTWMTGGFVGVDVFFVLSGYLITGLLLDEAARTGTVDLLRFWARRARRLLPALCLLLLVLAAVAAVDPRLVPPGALRSNGLAALFYVENWRLALQTHAQQVAQIFRPSPLLHTWSLAVEEQFYLLWPLVVLAVRPARRSRLWAVVVVGAAGSAAAMAAMSVAGVAPLPIYYDTGARAFELLIGAALALAAPLTRSAPRSSTACPASGLPTARPASDLPTAHPGPDRPEASPKPPKTKGRPTRPALPAPGRLAGPTGLVALAGVLVFATVADGVDAPWVLRGGLVAASLAAALLIWSVVARPAWPAARLLAWPPLVALGRISYAVYLWHWPALILLTSATTGLRANALRGVQLAFTLGAALVSRYLVENPARRLAPGMAVRRLVLPVGTTALACALVGIVIARPPAF